MKLLIAAALLLASAAFSAPNENRVAAPPAATPPNKQQGPIDAPAPALPPSAAPPAKEPDASDLADLGKDMEDFHKQAEKMLQQLETATGTAQKNGQPPTQLDLARQKAMKLASDDRFLNSLTAIWAHPQRNNMLLFQLGFFLFIVVLKAWINSRPKHWFRKLLIGFFVNILTVITISYVIPLLVIGEPFAVVTGTIFRVFIAG